jgi:hypothetical protein
MAGKIGLKRMLRPGVNRSFNMALAIVRFVHLVLKLRRRVDWRRSRRLLA